MGTPSMLAWKVQTKRSRYASYYFIINLNQFLISMNAGCIEGEVQLNRETENFYGRSCTGKKYVAHD